jgi:hypothetical protein
MTLVGVIVLVLSGILWFLAGSSSNGQPTLGPIYGGTWQTIFMATGIVGLILIVVGLVKKKKQPPAPPTSPTPSTSSTPPSPPTQPVQ